MPYELAKELKQAGFPQFVEPEKSLYDWYYADYDGDVELRPRLLPAASK